jgi:hypothetical protein
MRDPLARLPEPARERAVAAGQPSWTNPMLATLTDRRFSDPGWVFEPRFDGERCLAFGKGPQCGCCPATATGSTTTTRSRRRPWRRRRPTTSWSMGRWWPSQAVAAASPDCSGACRSAIVSSADWMSCWNHASRLAGRQGAPEVGVDSAQVEQGLVHVEHIPGGSVSAWLTGLVARPMAATDPQAAAGGHEDAGRPQRLPAVRLRP